ncbi:kinase-like domain-containing protein [Xylariaceae sp. AK1471]|nr:kinase-like domain-containing protein [Xylariaceae sp. AK1471]
MKCRTRGNRPSNTESSTSNSSSRSAVDLARNDVNTDPPSSRCDNIASFLALIQHRNIDILPITWHDGLKQLGTGTSGVVNQSHINLMTSFAFKRYNARNDRLENRNEYLREAFHYFANELRAMTEPWIRQVESIVDLFGVCWEAKYNDEIMWPVLVFEKAELGSLRHFLYSKPRKSLSLEDRALICRDCVLAVLTMHGCNIVHGDIKPDNILVFHSIQSRRYIAKMTDFGFSHFGKTDTEYITLPSTSPWEAPEHNKDPVQIRDAKNADVYSLGLLCLWVLFEGDLLANWDTYVSTHGDTDYRGLRRRDEKSLAKLKVETGLLRFAEEQTDIHWSSAQDGRIGRMKRFWSLALRWNSAERTSNVRELLDLISNLDHEKKPWGFSDSEMRYINRQPLVDGFGGTPRSFQLLIDQTSFIRPNSSLLSHQVSKYLYQLIHSDYRVRQQLINTLYLKLEANQLDNMACYQLALCKFMGFGTQETNQRLSMAFSASKSLFELERDVKQVSHARIAPEFKDAFMKLFEGGYIPTLHPGEIYGQGDVMHEIKRHMRLKSAT